MDVITRNAPAGLEGRPVQGRLVRTRTRAERVDGGAVDRLVGQLRGRQWVRRKRLSAELSWSDDYLRAVARYSSGQVIGSSSKGYGLTLEVPVGDALRVIAENRSRSRELNARTAEIVQVLNGRMRYAVGGVS